MANRKPLRFVTLVTGCYVPLSHRLNQDGYFRKRWGNEKLEMFHRTLWKYHHGEIPAGYEIHHICGNRACCNVKHLELIPVKEHTILTNRIRYQERKESAKEYWKTTGCTGTELGDRFGVSVSTGCRWIREWRAEAS